MDLLKYWFIIFFYSARGGFHAWKLCAAPIFTSAFSIWTIDILQHKNVIYLISFSSESFDIWENIIDRVLEWWMSNFYSVNSGE